MMLPDWWEAVILAGGAWRIFHLLAFDDILDRPRNYLVGLKPGADRRADGNEPLMDFLECPFCLGFWIVLGIWGLWQIWPSEMLIALTPFMLSAGLVGAQRLLSAQ